MNEPMRTNRIEETMREQGQCSELMEPVEAAITRHPFTSTMATFAVGLATGVCVGVALSTQSASLTTREKIGRRIADSLHGLTPQSFH